MKCLHCNKTIREGKFSFKSICSRDCYSDYCSDIHCQRGAFQNDCILFYKNSCDNCLKARELWSYSFYNEQSRWECECFDGAELALQHIYKITNIPAQNMYLILEYIGGFPQHRFMNRHRDVYAFFEQALRKYCQTKYKTLDDKDVD